MKKLSHEEFVAKANSVHCHRYKYYSPYQGSGIPLAITCVTHGVFYQTPNSHVSQKQGCPECAKSERINRQLLPVSSVIERFISVHGDKYDYSQVNYVGMHTPVSIVCPIHGAFQQSPHSHQKGRGCPQCATKLQQSWNSRRQLQIQRTFEAKARDKHGDLFDYSGVVYTHNQSKITFRCKKHDVTLTQTARDHLSGYNPCPQCNHMKSSQEEAIARFLSIFTTVDPRNRTILKPRELDVYLPEKNLAIEYCGMYWHSHGDKASERADKHKHADKHRDCAEQGIRLITLYETEWLERPTAVKRLLRNAIGKSRGKLMARKCELRKVTNAAARVFYDKYHPQGGDGHGEHYALFWKGKMVACMRFVVGANDRGSAKRRVWTLGRYATRVTVAGAASRLFKAFVTEHNPPVVKSFSDNRLFGGGMYEQLGFELEEEVAPDYLVWSQKIGLRPKSHYQRRHLQKRLQEHGVDDAYDHTTDPRTETEMTYLMGARRIYDCGKKRWIWHAPCAIRNSSPGQPD